MKRDNLFSQMQHGFVPFRNYTTNLLQCMYVCMNVWTDMLENGHPIDVIYTDFATAFNRVPHQRLLQKITGMGIIGSTSNWIKTFLSDRIQRCAG